MRQACSGDSISYALGYSMPEVFGPWQTVWTWHRRLARDGTWDHVLERLLAGADAAGMLDWAVSVDSTIVRAHQHATNTARHKLAPPHDMSAHTEPSDHAVGRSRGGLSTKIHQLVDGRGLPLVVLVAPGQSGDSPAFPHLLDQLRVPRLGRGRPRTRPDRMRGDKAYSSRAHRELLRRRRIVAVIAEPSDQAGHRRRRGSRGGRPPAFDPVDYRGRNVVERRFCHLKQWRGLATRYDKLAIVYRAALMLSAVVAWTKHLSDKL